MFSKFKLSIEQSSQLKNYKKEKFLNSKLLKLEKIELSTFKIVTEIFHKNAIPLNIFEKYIIKIIDRSEENREFINATKISELLFINKDLVRENLENLNAIGFLTGLNSDSIRVNKNENADYLQYENKFKLEEFKKTFELTSEENKNFRHYISNWFEQKYKDKKLANINILDRGESSKSVNLLIFENKEFLLFDKEINSSEDLKFLTKTQLSNSLKNLPTLNQNIFSHKEEFLPLIRDKLFNLNESKKIFFSGIRFDKNSIKLFESSKLFDKNKTFLLTNSKNEIKNFPENRVLVLEREILEEFLLIEDEIFYQKDNFIYSKKIDFKSDFRVSEFIFEFETYFSEKIGKDFDLENYKKLKSELEKIKIPKSTDEIEKEIQEIGKEKNELYGVKNSDQRKKVDNLENNQKLEEIEKNYPKYWSNRDDILELKDQQNRLQEEKKLVTQKTKDKETLQNKLNQIFSKDKIEYLDLLEELES